MTEVRNHCLLVKLGDDRKKCFRKNFAIILTMMDNKKVRKILQWRQNLRNKEKILFNFLNQVDLKN